ncbi:VOC family protein [Streptomyces sp. NPDC056500]|uniref:VOC family protein n=1 Tax=Streptomyces sp. NPDC056500 TaxID=3345840 RepID=UPI0036A2A7C9
MAGEISFFELGVADADKARSFYRELFGWSFTPGPSAGGGYAIETPNVAGGVHSGDPRAAPYLFFKVEDMTAARERVIALGGTVDDFDLGEDEATVARFGRFTFCRDDQGSPFGLHEPPS